MNALSLGFSFSICARWASTSSTGEIFLFRICPAISTAGRKVKSVMRVVLYFFFRWRGRAFASLPGRGNGVVPSQDSPTSAAQSQRAPVVAPRHPSLPSCAGSGDFCPHREQFRASSFFLPHVDAELAWLAVLLPFCLRLS